MTEAMVTLAPEIRAVFTPVPLAGLAGRAPLDFPLFLATGSGLPVLYRDRDAEFEGHHLERLRGEGVGELFIRERDAERYHRRVEADLDAVLRDRDLAVERRADLLWGVAGAVTEDLLRAAPQPHDVERARRLLVSAASMVLREPTAMAAVRRVLSASADLVSHSMVVSFLCLGTARGVIGADPAGMAQAGLAGLLHDVGRIGREDEVEDEAHVQEGLAMARRCRLPEPVCEAILSHHERYDGSGFPHRLAGRAIPVLGRLVGLVDTFETIYSRRTPRIGVYDSLRILAEVYRGCFDDEMAVALVRLFRA